MNDVATNELARNFVLFFAVIDPFGTLPVFLAVTRRHQEWEKTGIALYAVGVATAILLFFVLFGQLLLEAVGVPLPAFQVAGGIVLFLFALTMIFGESKPDEELAAIRSGKETAIFPLAVPSIASPGAMLAAVVLTDNHRFAWTQQVAATVEMLAVLAITLALLLTAGRIQRVIGLAGASVVSRVMGLILSAVAATSVLEGLKVYFELGP